jgi:hypothetical protein
VERALIVEAVVLGDTKPWTAAYLRLAAVCEVVAATRAFQVIIHQKPSPIDSPHSPLKL